MLQTIKKLRWIAKIWDDFYNTKDNYAQTRINTANRRIYELEKLIKDRTTIAVDVNYREPNTIIVIGSYNNRDYIQTFRVDKNDINYLIEELKKMEHYGTVRRIDAPAGIKFVIESELRKRGNYD